jgi:hypothetical protein
MVIRAALFGRSDDRSNEIFETLCADGAFVLADRGPIDAAIVAAPDSQERHEFADIDNADFIRLCVDPLIDLEIATAAALARLIPGGAILFVSTDAHLGQPDAAPQSAASGALMTLARSIAVRDPALRANLILLPYEADRHGPATAADAARIAAPLLMTPSLTGQAIYVDDGAHLTARHVGRR